VIKAMDPIARSRLTGASQREAHARIRRDPRRRRHTARPDAPGRDEATTNASTRSLRVSADRVVKGDARGDRSRRWRRRRQRRKARTVAVFATSARADPARRTLRLVSAFDRLVPIASPNSSTSNTPSRAVRRRHRRRGPRTKVTGAQETQNADAAPAPRSLCLFPRRRREIVGGVFAFVFFIFVVVAGRGS
jgi:hypothetical protein